MAGVLLVEREKRNLYLSRGHISGKRSRDLSRKHRPREDNSIINGGIRRLGSPQVSVVAKKSILNVLGIVAHSTITIIYVTNSVAFVSRSHSSAVL